MYWRFARVRSARSVVAIVVACTGCGRLWDASFGPGRDLTDTIAGFEKSNRMVITYGDDVKRDTTDRTQIAAVVNLFKKHPKGWLAISGHVGDYDVLLYENDRLIARVGANNSSRVMPGQDTINVESYFQRVPVAEVTDLMKQLNLPWPTPRN